MKRIQIKGKDHITITPKQLERMVDWFWMADNCGDNNITKQDRVLRDKSLSILNEIKQTK